MVHSRLSPRAGGPRPVVADSARGRDALLRVRGHAEAWLSPTPRVAVSYPTGSSLLPHG